MLCADRACNVHHRTRSNLVWLQDARLTAAVAVVQAAALQPSAQLLGSQALKGALQIVSHHAKCIGHLRSSADGSESARHSADDAPIAPQLAAVQWRLIEEHRCLSEERAGCSAVLAATSSLCAQFQKTATGTSNASCCSSHPQDVHSTADVGSQVTTVHEESTSPTKGSILAAHVSSAAQASSDCTTAAGPSETGMGDGVIQPAPWMLQEAALHQALRSGSELGKCRALVQYLLLRDPQMRCQGAALPL